MKEYHEYIKIARNHGRKEGWLSASILMPSLILLSSVFFIPNKATTVYAIIGLFGLILTLVILHVNYDWILERELDIRSKEERKLANSTLEAIRLRRVLTASLDQEKVDKELEVLK